MRRESGPARRRRLRAASRALAATVALARIGAAIGVFAFAVPERAFAQAVAPATKPPEKPPAKAPAIKAPATPPARTTSATGPLDPRARLVTGDSASEYWTLYVELDSGHRITQRFLITNAGPGDHSAVAVGHLMERGRAPYRYVNGRRWGAWTLSPDRLFLDIAASHLDLHRPKGALKITKEDIEIRLGFDLSPGVLSARIPASQLPSRYFVELLAAGAVTQGTLKAPWMTAPLAVTGRTWLVHTWTPDDEAALLDRRIDAFGRQGSTLFYGLQVVDQGRFSGAWQVLARPVPGKVESRIKAPVRWQDGATLASGGSPSGNPIPGRIQISGDTESGEIRLSREWLRFDPLDVIPQPFRWFIRRSSQPEEVWADGQIAVSIRRALENPSLPPSGEAELVSNSQRETEAETTESNVKGVASITFMNPIDRR